MTPGIGDLRENLDVSTLALALALALRTSRLCTNRQGREVHVSPGV
jgi:hypothetical protein